MSIHKFVLGAMLLCFCIAMSGCWGDKPVNQGRTEKNTPASGPGEDAPTKPEVAK